MHVRLPAVHVLTSLAKAQADCSCGTTFVISSTVADGLKPPVLQDKLIDMYHEHRDTQTEQRLQRR